MTFRRTYRAILTETLPYEVPVIFSNERLYSSIASKAKLDETQKILDRMRGFYDGFTIPYEYHIRKDSTKLTVLGIIHPNHQIRIADFYDHFHQSILSYCNRSTLTLRRPAEVVSVFSLNRVSKDGTLKLGIPHIVAADGETEAGHITSYFAYSRFNLLGRFVESKDFRDLEVRFPVLRTIDISKCFAHIYTHSVTWASKGKKYAKGHADVHSFEGKFDRLMQAANYNETNGIVIGPEVSRIFAEIILQDVDLNIAGRCAELSMEVDYEVRRYVDDYFVFARSVDVANSVQSAIEACLFEYKLYLNAAKTETLRRPFVSKISLARDDMGNLIALLHGLLDDLASVNGTAAGRKARAVAKHALGVRLICQRHDVAISSVSGWFMSQLRVLFRRSLKAIRTAEDEATRNAAEDIATSLLDAAFYVCAVDLRVRTTYSICQLLDAASGLKGPSVEARAKRIRHRIELGLEELVAQAARTTDSNSVELQNLLITGAHILGASFLRSPIVIRMIDQIIAERTISYFDFVSVKFCLLKNPAVYADKISRVNAMAASQIQANLSQIGKQSESFLLCCDYLSSPDISYAEKRAILSKILGGNGPSKAAVQEVSEHIGFVDWGGLRIRHMLARKELRPVYAWA